MDNRYVIKLQSENLYVCSIDDDMNVTLTTQLSITLSFKSSEVAHKLADLLDEVTPNYYFEVKELTFEELR